MLRSFLIQGVGSFLCIESLEEGRRRNEWMSVDSRNAFTSHLFSINWKEYITTSNPTIIKSPLTNLILPQYPPTLLHRSCFASFSVDSNFP